MVGAAGFEPTTPSPPDWCANQAAPRSDIDLSGAFGPEGVRKAADYRDRSTPQQARISRIFRRLLANPTRQAGLIGEALAGGLQAVFQLRQPVQQLFQPLPVRGR